MSLLRKLFFAKFVKHIELFSKGFIVGIANRGKLDLDNNLSVRDHHRDTSEKYF